MFNRLSITIEIFNRSLSKVLVSSVVSTRSGKLCGSRADLNLVVADLKHRNEDVENEQAKKSSCR